VVGDAGNALEEGDTRTTFTYQVRLATQPTTTVAIHSHSPTGPPLARTAFDFCTYTNVTTILATPPPQLRAVPAVLVFTPTNWHRYQTVVVTASADGGYPEGSEGSEGFEGGRHWGSLVHHATSADLNYNGSSTRSGSCGLNVSNHGLTNGSSCSMVAIPTLSLPITEHQWQPPPVLSSAVFDTTGTGLTIRFDSPTDGRGGQVNCNDYVLGVVPVAFPWCNGGGGR
jgi:hypothetical protein